MERRSFLHTLLAGGTLAAGRPLPGRTTSVPAASPPRAAPHASVQATDRGPIIDVHMHAYPADGDFPATLVNPATGRATTLKNGAAHLSACLAEMKRLHIVKGVVSGGDGDRLAAAAHWHDADPDRFIAAAGIRGSADTPLPELAVLRTAFQAGRLRVLGEITAAGLRPPVIHAANSAALLRMPSARFDLVRPGIACYGLRPSAEMCGRTNEAALIYLTLLEDATAPLVVP